VVTRNRDVSKLIRAPWGNQFSVAARPPGGPMTILGIGIGIAILVVGVAALAVIATAPMWGKDGL